MSRYSLLKAALSYWHAETMRDLLTDGWVIVRDAQEAERLRGLPENYSTPVETPREVRASLARVMREETFDYFELSNPDALAGIL